MKSLQRSKPRPNQSKPSGKPKRERSRVTITAEDKNSTDSKSTGLVLQHASSADSGGHDRWILDSGAT